MVSGTKRFSTSKNMKCTNCLLKRSVSYYDQPWSTNSKPNSSCATGNLASACQVWLQNVQQFLVNFTLKTTTHIFSTTTHLLMIHQYTKFRCRRFRTPEDMLSHQVCLEKVQRSRMYCPNKTWIHRHKIWTHRDNNMVISIHFPYPLISQQGLSSWYIRRNFFSSSWRPVHIFLHVCTKAHSKIHTWD